MKKFAAAIAVTALGAAIAFAAPQQDGGKAWGQGHRHQHGISGKKLAEKLKPKHQIFVYEADHGFNCDHRGSYNAPAAKQARQRTLEFFRKHIG